MAKTKKAKKKNGGAKTDFASKKAMDKLAQKLDSMSQDIGAAQQSGLSLGERLDQGLETLANDLRKVSRGIEAHVNAVKFEAGKQVEAARNEAAREITALRADLAKQIDAAKSDAARLVAAAKSEASALLADAGKASDQALAKLKEELAQARAEIGKTVKSAKAPASQRPAPASRGKSTASKAAGAPAKSPLKRRPKANGGAAKNDANA